MSEHGPEFERQNTKIGLALFALFLLLAGLTLAAGFIYLAVF